MSSRRRPRSFWEKLVAEADRVGSIERVARRHGVTAKRLTWWRWWLRRDARAKAKPRAKAKAKAPRLLPVVIEAGAVPSGSVIEIAVGDLRVRVEPGTELGYVAALVEALRRC
jgi:transposase-like protein